MTQVFLSPDRRQVVSSSGQVMASSADPMRLLMFLQWKAAADVCVGKLKSAFDLSDEAYAVVGERPETTTLAKDYSDAYATVDPTSNAAAPSDAYSFDGTDVAKLTKRLHYRELARGQALGPWVRAVSNALSALAQVLALQATREFWAALGVDLSDSGIGMVLAIQGGLGGTTAAPELP